MTKTAAQKQAREESSMYRQGSGWIISTWDTEYKAYYLSGETPYFTARAQLADWRKHRVAELMERD